MRAAVCACVLVLASCGTVGAHGAQEWTDKDHKRLSAEIRDATPVELSYMVPCVIRYVEDHWTVEQINDENTDLDAKAGAAVDYCV